MPTKKVMRSSESGKFVSKVVAEINPATTYEDTVPTGAEAYGVKEQILELLEGLEEEGFELEEVEVLSGGPTRPDTRLMTIRCVVPIQLTFSKPEGVDVLADAPLGEADDA